MKSSTCFFAILAAISVSANAQQCPDIAPYQKARAAIQDLGRIVAPSGIQESYKTKIGGIDQWLSVRGQDKANPIILFIHGGPASPLIPTVWQFQRPLEEYFTVVNYDQRGAGKTYVEDHSDATGETLHIPRYVDDAIEIAEYVRGLAAERPLVVVLDEMQWADSTSWDALEHLLTQVDTDRIMICLAQRPESGADASLQRQILSRHEFVRELMLSRLTRDEVKQWLEAAFHRQQVGREFLAFLYRHTEGNPLFIAQLLRALIEDGAIWYSGTRWEWSPVSELRVPAGRGALIAQRVSKFSSSTQAVLGTAAIIGREFDIGLLVGAGAGSEPAVRLALSEAVLAGLIRPTYERRLGGYAFAHDEIAEVLVDALSRDRTPQLHARVAQSLERRRPDRAAEIAMHFDAAREPADAYRWAQIAAKSAEAVYAPGSAGAYLQMAGRNATSPAELAEIRVALAHVAETRGRYDEVEELCDLAIEWFEGQADERRALTIRRMRERARIETDTVVGHLEHEPIAASRPRNGDVSRRLSHGETVAYCVLDERLKDQMRHLRAPRLFVGVDRNAESVLKSHGLNREVLLDQSQLFVETNFAFRVGPQ